MFKKISYMCMLLSVLLSWGFLLSFARSADQADATAQAAAARHSRITIGNYTPQTYVNSDLREPEPVAKQVKLKTSKPAKTVTTTAKN
jgi:hypothetical protein